MEEKIKIPENVKFEVVGQQLLASGTAGEIKRLYPSARLGIKVKEDEIILTSKIENTRSKSLIKTFRAHILNMLKGAQEPFTYKLIAASVHFPMNLNLTGNKLTISNFLGSKKPRVVALPAGVDITISGKEILLKSPDIELAGMASTRLEQATRLSNKDRRVFQDGIFITEKAGKKI